MNLRVAFGPRGLLLLLLLLLVPFAAAGCAGRRTIDVAAMPGAPSLPDAMATLSTTDYFATARVRRPTPCQIAFDVVLAQSNAADLFQQLVDSATLPGKLYGLTGLWLTDRAAYAEAAPTLLATRDQITCLSSSGPIFPPAGALVRHPDEDDIDSGIIPLEFEGFATQEFAALTENAALASDGPDRRQ